MSGGFADELHDVPLDRENQDLKEILEVAFQITAQLEVENIDTGCPKARAVRIRRIPMGPVPITAIVSPVLILMLSRPCRRTRAAP